ncbi:RNA 2',3'-cyclic phosphodiesterase [Haliangium ochraceum]|uniref:RNA 2',3'-cyclic phosphodiesterase n=1 Tax=Haliangium ochraceum (strain DSM 14365 / JCM 11303 / SMP-2) TaxID=502025 RepID=D0LIM3_HALO1|nr:RNA 2',3'-cyclic phosphodiesterase [Haliangium ochraceum]ACY18379.1 2'-5' RNA ligase [Haliangium ochraceum DSM 14365]
MIEGSGRVRLFLGVQLGVEAVRDAAAVAEALRRRASESELAVRWLAPANYHLTLKFLGWTPPEAVTALRDALAAPIAEVGRFDLIGRGLGAFPEPAQARVLWAGIDDATGGLAELARVLDDACHRLGFAREARAYHPHLTLGRLKTPSDLAALLGEAAGAGAEGVSAQVFRKTPVTAVTLFESVLKSDGSEYLLRAQFRLAKQRRTPQRHTGSVEPPATTRVGTEGKAERDRTQTPPRADADTSDVAAAGGSGSPDSEAASRAGEMPRAPDPTSPTNQEQTPPPTTAPDASVDGGTSA